MQLMQPSIAGSMESGDILIELEHTTQPGIAIELDSTVGNQYGRQIRAVIETTLRDCGIKSASVRAVDKGALDCTIRARVIAAAHRGANSSTYRWE